MQVAAKAGCPATADWPVRTPTHTAGGCVSQRIELVPSGERRNSSVIRAGGNHLAGIRTNRRQPRVGAAVVAVAVPGILPWSVNQTPTADAHTILCWDNEARGASVALRG